MSMMVECMKGNLLQASDQRMNSIWISTSSVRLLQHPTIYSRNCLHIEVITCLSSCKDEILL
jgi:hypothetical protein